MINSERMRSLLCDSLCSQIEVGGFWGIADRILESRFNPKLHEGFSPRTAYDIIGEDEEFVSSATGVLLLLLLLLLFAQENH